MYSRHSFRLVPIVCVIFVDGNTFVTNNNSFGINATVSIQSKFNSKQ